MNTRWSANTLLALTTATFTLAGLAGCVNYANAPGLPNTVANTSPNLPAVEQVMMAGLEWAAERYPVPQPATAAVVDDGEAGGDLGGLDLYLPRMTINLPEGTRGRVYERIAALIPGAEPLTPENSHLPIYHVGGVRIRGDRAVINIFRPITDIGHAPTGETVYQEIRVELRGGFRPWHVVSWREWTPGSGDVPELNYYTPDPPPAQQRPRIRGVYH